MARKGLLVSSCTRNAGKPLQKRAVHGKTIKDEWNSDCDRPELWQVYGKLVGSEFTAFNADEVLGKLPDTTSWAWACMGHRSEIAGYKLSKVEDASLSR